MSAYIQDNKYSLYLLAGIPVISIVLFITGFYTGTSMSEKTIRSVMSDAKADVTIAQLEQPDILNELTEKTPPGAGTASNEPTTDELPVTKVVTDEIPDYKVVTDEFPVDKIASNIVQRIDKAIEIALATAGAQNNIEASEVLTDNSDQHQKPAEKESEIEEPKVLADNNTRHQKPVERNSKLDNQSNDSNQLYTIQVGSFLKENNALSLSNVLAAKNYNTRILVATSPSTLPTKQYKVLIGLFASLDTATQKATDYAIKERLPAYVIPSSVWSVSNNRML